MAREALLRIPLAFKCHKSVISTEPKFGQTKALDEKW